VATHDFNAIALLWIQLAIAASAMKERTVTDFQNSREPLNNPWLFRGSLEYSSSRALNFSVEKLSVIAACFSD